MNRLLKWKKYKKKFLFILDIVLFIKQSLTKYSYILLFLLVEPTIFEI